ncbi:MAG: cupin domain-containing protein [Anaerolineales bacterium]
MTADEIIEFLNLQRLPVEGGYFRQSYRAADTVSADALPGRYRRDKTLCTAIYYLLTADPDNFSALHRLPTDEIYHFYLGDPVEMLLLYPDGASAVVRLGPDLRAGQQVQFVVSANVWQGSRLASGGTFALLGTTMAPGYDEADYSGGERGALSERYPDRRDLIRELTRE